MAEVGGFEHISVTTDDDDVVIHAGIGSAREEAAPAVDDSDAPSPSLRASATNDAEGASAKAVATAASRKKDDTGYRETTLEDLAPEPMSKTQKIVIACAIVVLVAAIVYYFAFMR